MAEENLSPNDLPELKDEEKVMESQEESAPEEEFIDQEVTDEKPVTTEESHSSSFSSGRVGSVGRIAGYLIGGIFLAITPVFLMTPSLTDPSLTSIAGLVAMLGGAGVILAGGLRAAGVADGRDRGVAVVGFGVYLTGILLMFIV